MSKTTDLAGLLDASGDVIASALDNFSGGSGGGGSATLDGMTDVTTSGSVNDHILGYNGATWSTGANPYAPTTGTFTPEMSNVSGTEDITYNSRSSFWTRYGDIVHWSFTIDVAAWGGANFAQEARIYLPFTVANISVCTSIRYDINIPSSNSANLEGQAGTDYALIMISRDNADQQTTTAGSFQNGGYIAGVLTYFTDDA